MRTVAFLFYLPLLLVGLAAIPAAVGTPTPDVEWSVSAPTPSNGGSTTVAFVDREIMVIHTSPPVANDRGESLQLFAVATHQQRWTLPEPCPFKPRSTTIDPSSTTVVGFPAVYHVQRTGLQQLTYLCWSVGQPHGHAVSVNTVTGNITAEVAVHSKALGNEPGDLRVVSSLATGAYCAVASRDALCVSQHGQVWHLGLGNNYDTPSISEYNGTLAVQHSGAVQLYDLWTGTLKSTVALPGFPSKGIVAGERYLVVQYTQQTPCTVVTLDMQTGVLSGVVTLPNSTEQTPQDTARGASTVALLVGNGAQPPVLAVTLPSKFYSLLGWAVPATTATAVAATQLFDTSLQLGATMMPVTTSWAISPTYVVVVCSQGYETSTSGEKTHVLRLQDGSLVTSFSSAGAPVSLTSVSEQDGYVAVSGVYSAESVASFSSGSGVTVLNATTGMPVWTRGNAEIIGPDMLPLDTAAGCLMVAPSQWYTGTEWGLVECVAL